MIDNLLSMFGIHKIGLIVGMASQIVRTFEQEFAADVEAKGSAIDGIIALLQTHQAQMVAGQAEQESAPVATPSAAPAA